MKHKSECFTLLNNMIDCICQLSDNQKSDFFIKSYNQLRNTLHKEFFTPFDREDIFMIAVKLNCLFSAVENNKSIQYISPLLNKIKQIIKLFDNSEKNKFRNIFDSITEYQNINKDEILFYVSDIEKTKVINLIEKCDDTVIQIEYTILKNS